MDELKKQFWTWLAIFKWANICIWEKFTRQEVSCPDCWKCTTARWVTFSAAILAVGFCVHLLFA